MEDDFDIYEDLDFGKKKHEDNCQTHQNNEELLEKVKKLEERVKHLELELTNESSQRKVLETNFSSLLKTAKNELSRKDRTISDLRAQIDNFYFRRKKVQAQTNDNAKNNLNTAGVKKDSEPTTKCQVEKRKEVNGLDKPIPLYLSPAPQLHSQFESLSDSEDTEVTCQPNQLVSTVFGERLKKRLKEQAEKEKLEIEQANSLTCILNNNEAADAKTEVQTTNINNMDNKENQYRLISLDISPKKTIKRGNEEPINEVLDKRKKYFELSEASQSCKSRKKDHVENSGNCTDKFINTNIHTGEYFCSVEGSNNSLENLVKYRKKSPQSPEHDKRAYSSRNVNERDDRNYKKYRDNEYRDNQSKSKSRIISDSEKSYSYIDRGSSRGKGRYYNSRDETNYYNRNDDFNRKRSRNCLEVRRSRRIEAKSHSHHSGQKEDSKYYSRDDYKRRHEEKSRTRRKSRSRERSRDKNSADSMSSRKNDSRRTDSRKEKQIELNNGAEEGEILDNSITNEEMNIINNIFEGNDETVRNNDWNPVLQSPREEKIENIQEFIQKFNTKNEIVKADDENLKKNRDCSTVIALKINDNKNSHHNLKEEKTEIIQKGHLDQQPVNTNTKNIEKIDQKENKESQDIIPKKEQPQDPELKLPSNNNSKPISKNVELKQNECDTNKAKIIQNNEDKNNLDQQPEAVTCSTKNQESTTKQKPRIVKIDNFQTTRDPEYCKILSKYLKKKPELHNITRCKTSTFNVTNDEKKNTQNKNEESVEEAYAEPVENTKTEKSKKEELLKVETDKCMTINTSLDKSEESSLSSTSSVLKTVCEPEPTINPVDEKVKSNECFVSPIPKNPIKRTTSKNNINVKKPSTITGSEAKKVIASRKKKEKVDENQNSSEGVMILTARRRPMRLSDFSSPVTVVSTTQNADSNQNSKEKWEVIKE